MIRHHRLNSNFRMIPGIVAMGAAAANAAAAVVVIDDFSDGSDDGWEHIDGTMDICDEEGIFDASKRSYRIESSCELPSGSGLSMASRWIGAVDPTFTDGYLEATIRHGNESTAAWLSSRVGNDGLYGYRFILPAHGRSLMIIWVGEPAGEVLVAALIAHEPMYQAGDLVHVKAGTVGDQISMKIWKDGEAEPYTPQLIANNAVYTEGDLVIGATHEGEEAVLSVEFDDIMYTARLAGDANDDGSVNFFDILEILADWGYCNCPSDLNLDGVLNFEDILIVLRYLD